MFDENRLDNFANRSSSKWRRFPADVMPMHVAEMDFEVAQEIRLTLSEMVKTSDLGYLGPIPEVANSFHKYAKAQWGWEIDKSKLRLATDVGVAAVEILRGVTTPGEKVLINSPVYSSFYHWIHEVGAKELDVPLVRVGDDWKLDLPGIEKAFEEGVKVFMLCSPQNPVGRLHTKAELQAVSDLANKFGVLVIADEIHAPLSFAEFTPYLTVPGAEKNGVVITSSSKAWNTAGLKAAFLLTQSDEVNRRINVPEAMHWRSSLLGAFAMATAFESCQYWIDETNQRLKENHQFLKAELARELPKAKLANLQATYLAWIDLGEYGFASPQQQILKHGKVALVTGEEHAPESQYSEFVRFNFATSKPRIAEAVRRMKLGLES